MKPKYQCLGLALFTLIAGNAGSQTTNSGYNFAGGFPTPGTIQNVYNDSDLSRAIEAYKFFYPAVSFSAGFVAMEKAGIKVNSGAGLMDAGPRQLVFTANSDTPYAAIPL